MENIFYLANKCLSEKNLANKVLLSAKTANKIAIEDVSFDTYTDSIELSKPGRPKRPVLISPKNVPKRNIQTIEGRAAMIHSFSHIEFNAINLAWDLICRFQDMPKDFYLDWSQVAAEETKHFELLQENLNTLGYDYGDFPAHDGLWEIAEKTQHNILLRLAVVPRIMEARGLDVTPNLIERFKSIKDTATVSILELILKEEIGHVKFGSKWFHYLCKKMNYDPESKFIEIANKFLPDAKIKNINHEARLSAGFSTLELDYLAKN